MPQERNDPPTDAARWIQKARTGDHEAFAALCETSRRRIWRVIASVTRGNRAETEDLAQETVVRAFRAMGTFQGEEAAAFDAWICRIALHAAHDYQKSAWRRRVVFWSSRATGADSARSDDTAAAEWAAAQFGGFAPAAHEEAERRRVQQQIRAAVAGLNAKERVPIFLIYFEQFSLAEVARLEGVPESTVRSRVKVGLRRLERVLNEVPHGVKCEKGFTL